MFLPPPPWIGLRGYINLVLSELLSLPPQSEHYLNAMWGISGPQSYFQQIGIFSWSLGTIVDQFAVEGAHQWPFKKTLTISLKFSEYRNFPQQSVENIRIYSNIQIYLAEYLIFKYKYKKIGIRIYSNIQTIEKLGYKYIRLFVNFLRIYVRECNHFSKLYFLGFHCNHIKLTLKGPYSNNCLKTLSMKQNQT